MRYIMLRYFFAVKYVRHEITNETDRKDEIFASLASGLNYLPRKPNFECNKRRVVTGV